MIFGADTPDVLESKINNLEEQITDAEETVKNTKEELRWSMYLVSYWSNCNYQLCPQAFSQMGIQASFGQPLIKENWFYYFSYVVL